MFAAFYWHRRVFATAIAGCIVVAASCVRGQIALSNSAALANYMPAPVMVPSVSETSRPGTNQAQNAEALAERSVQIRTACINGRRRICGRVLQVIPGGLVVDSGYPGLLRPELGRSWVVPSNVSASRPPNLVEEKTPGSMCVGSVFVTDIPKKPLARVYDYIVLPAYPAGQSTYTPLGAVKQTVRRFSAVLEKAVELNLQVEDKPRAAGAEVK